MSTRVEYRIVEKETNKPWSERFNCLGTVRKEFSCWASPSHQKIVKVTITTTTTTTTTTKPKDPKKFKSGWYSFNQALSALYNQNCRIRSTYSPWIVLGPEGSNYPIFEEPFFETENEPEERSPCFWKSNYLKKWFVESR